MPNIPEHFKHFLIVPLLAALAWGFFVVVGTGVLGCSPQSLQFTGQLGDSFGILNSAFSAVGMSAAMYALILQIWQNYDSKEHDKEMLRREKFEKLLNGIDKFRVVLLTSSMKFFRGDLSKIETYDLGVDIMSAHSEALILARLYFPSFVDRVIPQKVYEQIIEPMNEFVKKLDAWSDAEKNERKNSIQKQFLATMSSSRLCLDFALLNSENILKGKESEELSAAE